MKQQGSWLESGAGLSLRAVGILGMLPPSSSSEMDAA
eukprot:CAMPEP_0180501686 /NCGR_PEP_ID=MMETSP1036_2-20121128/45018_1 /TAXON_ID=632150 /ORGANISM="Azadinium spinosum, Strain 3D9" /LENGTH=36 /DNA_ID= /DNA_START= /DNA_END= /DNA_ORIENTATION=